MATNATNQVPTKTTGKSAEVGKSDGNGRVKSFPAPKQLATPTDLKAEEVQAVVEAVNPLIADAFALYVKTKNYHWHLASSHFRDYHLLLDEQAESIFDSIDPLAERVRRIGGTTLTMTKRQPISAGLSPPRIRTFPSAGLFSWRWMGDCQP